MNVNVYMLIDNLCTVTLSCAFSISASANIILNLVCLDSVYTLCGLIATPIQCARGMFSTVSCQ